MHTLKPWQLLVGIGSIGLVVFSCWWLLARPGFPIPADGTQVIESDVIHAGSGYSYEITYTFLGSAGNLVAFYHAQGYSCRFDSSPTMRDALQTPDGGWECIGTGRPQSRVYLSFPRGDVKMQALPVRATVSWSDQLFR